MTALAKYERVFLSGFMAAGKTAVGCALAERLDLPFVDLDGRIEARVGRPIPEIFERDGEAAFRRLEQEALEALCEEPRFVASLGGGAITRAESRRRVRACGMLVWLNTPRSTILARLEKGDSERPLYRDARQATELLESRLESYRDCDLEVRPRSGETPTEVAARIVRELR